MGAEPNWSSTADTLASVYAQERLDRAVTVLHQAAPAEVETFEVHHHKVGDVLAVEQVNRADWVAQHTQPACTQEAVKP